ncbi:MAG: hypothetical protein II892_08775 [Fibrobacter sp.]|nr:hypothetical protein [Fibrobacter sp.]
MNRIILYGFALTGLAALFWACGSGEVVTYNDDDQMMEYTYGEDDVDGSNLRGMVEQAVSAYCDMDENRDACLAATRPDDSYIQDSSKSKSSSSSYVPVSKLSSSSRFSPFASTASSSSRSGITPVYASSSSRSGITPVYASSSSRSGITPVLTSSSSSSSKISSRSSSSRAGTQSGATTLPEDVPWGTCVANLGNPGSRGVPLKWQFTIDRTAVNGNVSVMTSSTYSWEFDGADPATFEKTGSTGLTSTPVTYDESGRFGARVTMTYNGQSQTVECDTADIMGYPVTDCECVPDKEEVDVAEESIASGATLVTWTVSKCKSEDKSFTYEWEDGMTADGASASMTLDEKIAYKPKVTVRNSDNGSMVVTCNVVNTIDSDHPEFEFKEQNAEVELPAGESTVYFNMPQNWHNGDAGNCTFSCNKIGDNPVTVTLGSFTPVTNYYVEIKVPISSTIGMTPMKLTLSGPAKCKLGW